MEKILNQLFVKFGYIPMVWALEELERLEHYDKCSVLMSFLDEVENKYDISIQRRITSDTEQNYVEAFEEWGVQIDYRGDAIKSRIPIDGVKIVEVILSLKTGKDEYRK